MGRINEYGQKGLSSLLSAYAEWDENRRCKGEMEQVPAGDEIWGALRQRRYLVSEPKEATVADAAEAVQTGGDSDS